MRRARAGVLFVASAGVALAACSSEPQEPAEGARGPAPEDPEQLLVGEWEQGEARFVFDADGTFDGSERGVELSGRYRWVDETHIEMDVTIGEGVEATLTRRVAVSESELRLVEDGGMGVTLERVR